MNEYYEWFEGIIKRYDTSPVEGQEKTRKLQEGIKIVNEIEDDNNLPSS